jgi:antibiotic biosynthesis monooxygenase (ABM) superfamily enzyme
MDTTKPTDTTATVIIGHKVRRDCETEFLAWQHAVNDAASHYPGFIAAEVNSPTAVQPDFVIIYRFDSIANVQAWINSATRQDAIVAGRRSLDGPPTQQIVGGETKPTDQLVTVVVTHRVPAENVEEFLAWQERLRLAESKFDGFRGSEVFRPIEGVQDDWTAMYRYDNAAALEAWLTSDQRRRLLDEGKKFNDFELRTVDNSFGSWFAFDENGKQAAPPSEIKTSIVVWVGLYPTVVILNLLVWPLKMPIWLGMLVGNLLSSFAITFLVMPYYVNPLLKHWLRPPPDVPRARTNWQGIGIVAGLNLFWVVVFYLITRVFWHLP